MSLRINTLIEITQVPNDAFPDRKKSFTIDFVSSGIITAGWESLTDTAKLKFPRNIMVEDESGRLVNWTDKAIYGDYESQSPLFMRGDEISISIGYFYDNFDGTETSQMPIEPQFTGFISKIKNRLPIEIECEDNFWKLKQIPVANKLFKGSQYTVKSMIAEMLKDHPYTVIDGGFETSIGDFRTQNETVAQVLERLKNEGRIYSYFRGNVLRVGLIVYDPNTFLNNQEVFEFQENIISDSLEYTRKEDLNIAIKVSSHAFGKGSGTNADGTGKNKRKRLEVLVGKVTTAGKTTFGEIANDKTYFGDVITMQLLLNAPSKEELIKRAKAILPKYYYTGFRGSFITFGQPTISHGWAAIIRDSKVKEREGTYLIKEVSTEFGMQGFRQKIQLHHRIDQGFTTSELNEGACG
jgi:hypothetical protein